MKEYFALDAKERRDEKIMLVFLFIFFACIALGTYLEFKQLNYNDLLVPTFLIAGGCFFLLNGINGLRKGNLVLKYTPVGIPFLLQYLLRRIGSVSADKARIITAKTLGIISLFISILLFFFVLLFIIKAA